ncbi:MAG TPA: hypothetical protein ENJ40_00845 [Thermosulfurimonas dismutans]|uniref:Uncharacterized protein n=1 Tax=Thermosulfurimonas dismutans TaxID=999894 RepID=A0A7C3CJ40_9BACT|nr:hypothetical protein [Thermosulfurimonas dismutans]
MSSPLKPTLYLVSSFAGAIILGTILLSLPWMHHDELALIDALFTATSAVCVTGLTVVDTASAFTLPGKVVIMILIQLGGLGVMTFYSMFFLLRGRRIPIEERLILRESFWGRRGGRLSSLILTILFYTMVVEFLVTLLLFPFLARYYSWPSALFHALFHAVSAFCNAGFSDLPGGLVPFARSYFFPLILMLAILAGNTGFPIVFEGVHRFRQKNRSWSLHFKLTLLIHLLLVLIGALIFLWLENGGALREFPAPLRVLQAVFLSVTPRTAGFSFVDIRYLSVPSLYFLLFLMLVGACPGSTGGGIKTTTFGVLAATVWSRLRGFSRTSVFGRTIPDSQVTKALTLVGLYLLVIFTAQFFLISLPPHRPFLNSGSEFLAHLFEVFSALGTVGLSTGITPHLSTPAKGVLILTMFTGRVGVLSLAMLLSGLPARSKTFYYAQEEVLLG